MKTSILSLLILLIIIKVLVLLTPHPSAKKINYCNFLAEIFRFHLPWEWIATAVFTSILFLNSYIDNDNSPMSSFGCHKSVQKNKAGMNF